MGGRGEVRNRKERQGEICWTGKEGTGFKDYECQVENKVRNHKRDLVNGRRQKEK